MPLCCECIQHVDSQTNGAGCAVPMLRILELPHSCSTVNSPDIPLADLGQHFVGIVLPIRHVLLVGAVWGRRHLVMWPVGCLAIERGCEALLLPIFPPTERPLFIGPLCAGLEPLISRGALRIAIQDLKAKCLTGASARGNAQAGSAVPLTRPAVRIRCQLAADLIVAQALT